MYRIGLGRIVGRAATQLWLSQGVLMKQLGSLPHVEALDLAQKTDTHPSPPTPDERATCASASFSTRRG